MLFLVTVQKTTTILKYNLFENFTKFVFFFFCKIKWEQKLKFIKDDF